VGGEGKVREERANGLERQERKRIGYNKEKDKRRILKGVKAEER